MARQRWARRGPRRIYTDWLEAHDEETARRYEYAWRNFADHLGVMSGHAAFAHLLRISPGEANYHAEKYAAALDRRGLAPNTINLRLSALRSLMAEAQKLGKGHGLKVRGYRVTPFRDVRGPGMDSIRTVLFELEQQDDPASMRDAAMIRLMFERGLRRAEVARLRIRDVSFKPPPAGVWILGKKRKEYEYCSMPKGSLRAVRDWLDYRGQGAKRDAALFCRLDAQGDCLPEGLDGQGVYYVVRNRFADLAGVGATPHGIRHTGATAVFELCNHDIQAVKDWGRWGNLATAQHYDDAVRDQGGVLGEELSDLASQHDFGDLVEPEQEANDTEHDEEERDDG